MPLQLLAILIQTDRQLPASSLCQYTFLIIPVAGFHSNMLSVLCFSVLLLAVSAEDSVTLSPPVDTSYGPVQGAVQTYDGTTVHVFKGIPFAAPPVGELRFASPVAPESWTDPLRCVEYRNRCWADTATDGLYYPPPRVAPPMDEDCLHLTVVVPQIKTEQQK